MAEGTNRTDPRRPAWLALAFVAACAHTDARGAHEVSLPGFTPHTSQIELQQSVERHATVFVERAGLEFESLITLKEVELGDHALRLYVRYASSALEIASGLQPEVNVLDLLVFVMLTRASMEQYWMPQVFGARAGPLLRAMQTSEQELWTWAEGVIADDKRAQLRTFIVRWLEAHPAAPRLEWVRFAEFASISADVERSQAASGILASVRSVTRTADAALLLSERALFLAQRAPALLRVQARLGARELLADGLQRLAGPQALLEQGEGLLKRTEALRPLVQDLQTLSSGFGRTIEEARTLTVEMRELAKVTEPLLVTRVADDGDASTGIEQLVASTHALSESAGHTIAQARLLAQAAGVLTEGEGERLDRLLRKWTLYAVVLSVLFSGVFWSGYFVVSRLLGSRH
ncbi:MAG TPA: hypothetical protein VI299_09005 [Polyangiales bacterium]